MQDSRDKIESLISQSGNEQFTHTTKLEINDKLYLILRIKE